MDMTQFFSEIRTDPLARGYAGMSNDDLWTSLSTKDRSRVKAYRLNGLTILNKFGPARGAAILQGVRTAAGSNAMLSELLKWIDVDSGVDISHPDSAGVFAGLVAGGICTQDEANLIAGMAVESISRLEEINCGDCSKEYMIYLRGLV